MHIDQCVQFSLILLQAGYLYTIHMSSLNSDYNKSRQNTKRVTSLAKGKKQKECARDLNDSNHQNDFFEWQSRW